MKHKKLLFCLFIGILFYSCVSLNNNENIPDNLIFYTLSKGETLSAFIENQNNMNDYALFENEPTEREIREVFASYEEYLKNFISELSEEALNEFSEIFFGISIENFAKLNFLYSICYNRENRVWYIDLIGRSTTLYLEYSSNRDYAYKNQLRYKNNLIPSINRWMDLNNIPSLESGFRLNINDDLDDVIIELFGVIIK